MMGSQFKNTMESGGSPVMALKKRRSKRMSDANKKMRREKKQLENVVVLEDLGVDYLEQLLTSYIENKSQFVFCFFIFLLDSFISPNRKFQIWDLILIVNNLSYFVNMKNNEI